VACSAADGQAYSLEQTTGYYPSHARMSAAPQTVEYNAGPIASPALAAARSPRVVQAAAGQAPLQAATQTQRIQYAAAETTPKKKSAKNTAKTITAAPGQPQRQPIRAQYVQQPNYYPDPYRSRANYYNSWGGSAMMCPPGRS
jgi:hypothetical protein